MYVWKLSVVNKELLHSEEQSLVKPLTGGRGKNPHWLGSCVSPHFTFFFSLSKQTECWSAENMMLSHFSCRVFKPGLWERVCYNSMTEVIPLSIWALNGPLKYSLVRKNVTKWRFLIFFLLLLFLSQQITAWIWKCSSIIFACLSGQAFSQC